VGQADLQQLAQVHRDLSPALLRLLVRQLLHLTRTHGVPCRGGEVRIGLRVRQDLLAEMLGCSRQRVDEQLMALARARLIRKEAGSLVVRDRQLLQQFADQVDA
jgi:CRP/FNR family transcriptional regulator, cyclic AMP receptor protein